MCWSLKCTGEWPTMPYVGLFVHLQKLKRPY